ncbi:MFS transporter [Lactobacillaceae bacterium L1_55_11]|nr:MFS transporter [Lactobacillaceae bacterium L1_55_11]
MNDTGKLSPRLILSILAIALLGFTDIMLETALNVSFPVMMKELSVNAGTIQWLTSGVILLTTVVVILSPWLKQRFTNRSQFTVAAIVSIIGISIDAMSTQFGWILFGRLLQGVGGGVGLPLMYNVVFEQVPERKRGTMIGLASLIVAFAPALGPSFGGFLTEHFGWRMIFWVVLPIQIGSLLLGWVTIRQVDRTVKEKLDWLGWLLLTAFFVGGLFAIENFSGHGLLYLPALIATAFMIVGMVGYYFHAKHYPEPLLDLSMFKSSIFSMAVIAAVIIQVVNLTFNYAIPMGLQLILHQNSQVAGLALFPGACGFALMSIVSGHLYDRYGVRFPNYLGLTLILMGVCWFSAVPFTVWSMTAGFAIINLGAGCWFGNNMTNAISHLPRHLTSGGNSIFSAVNNYSAAVGIAIAAGVIGAFQKGGSSIAESTRAGITWIYAVDIFFDFIAAALSLRLVYMSTKKDRS